MEALEKVQQTEQTENATPERPLRADRPEPVKSIKEQLLSMPRGRPVPVDMRRFSGWPQLFVKPPTGAQIAAWEQGGVEYGRKGRVKVKVSPNRKAELIQMCLCNEGGDLIFGVKEASDIARLDAAVVNHLFAAARKVSGQEVEDDDEEEDEEGAEGN